MAMASKIHIDVYSHNVKVSKYDARGLQALLAFCRPLVQTGIRPNGRGGFVRESLRTFAAATADRREFRFHRHQKEKLLEHLKYAGFDEGDISLTHHPDYEVTSCAFVMDAKFIMRDYQVPAVEYLIAPGRTKVLTLQTGKGKAQPLDAKIKVPGGWKRMGDIRVGDKVIASDGQSTSVIGVFPQGRKQIYRVTFADGRHTEACAEHLWKVYYVNTSPGRRWRIVTTEEMLRLISMPNPRVYVPLTEPVDDAEAELPIDPYVLGVFLGDGTLTYSPIRLSNSDQEIIDKVESRLPDTSTLSGRMVGTRGIFRVIMRRGGRLRDNVFTQHLMSLGLIGSRSYNKFIPEVYLHASARQRLDLLQGLMDTDGTAFKRGSVQYSTSSYELAKGVQYLVRSLGGIASIAEKRPFYSHNGERKEGRLSYTVNIRHRVPSQMFSLLRKQEQTNDENQYSHRLKLRVTSIEPVGEKEAQCISIAHWDRLYLTDDFIVTHNTLCTLKAAADVGVRTALVIKGMYVDKWVGDVSEMFGLKPGEVMVVRGSKDLRALIALAKAGELEAMFIIITVNTINNYLKHFERYGDGDEMYGVRPEDFYKLLGVGLRIIDEAHQEFHANFRQDLYFHVPKAINLSATLEPDDPFMRRMYEILFPRNLRFQGVEYDKYIAVRALFYSLSGEYRIRYMGRRRSYSHVVFEQSIMKSKKLAQKYMEMIAGIIETSFLYVMEPGQKMLIFAATVDFCTLLTDFLKARYPDLKINRYVAEDDYTNLMESDISVSTIKSAGTAVDIDGLRVTLMTDAINSRQSNEQTVGRLRRLKNWPETTPEFIYLVCRDIPQHVRYHERKKEFLDDKVLSLKEYDMDFEL